MTASLCTLLVLVGPARAGVELGSYGRVQVSTDARGGAGEPVNVVSHGSRLEQGPYLELDVVFASGAEDALGYRVVVTPALSGDLFHYDGQWDADLALRNLYLEVDGFSRAPLVAWAGARMWRGDDIYLLDFWPLDDLNTVGGGLSYRPPDWALDLHGGLNRLDAGDWMVQTESVPLDGGVGTEEVLVLDRQRFLGSARLGRTFEGEALALRLRGYGELHLLPEGSRIAEDFVQEALPANRGTVLGLQASAWGWAEESFVHLWYRYATGLAAWDELSVPETGYASDWTVTDASEHLVALAGNHEAGPVGVMAGTYLRRFQDADHNDVDVDDRWEAIAALRPTVFFTDHLSLGLEASHQWLRPDGLNPRSGAHDLPQITKLAVLPAIQPRRGGFARPQLRLQYVYSYLDDDARWWFAQDDVRRRSHHQHFVGVGAEWWLNSASYR